MLYISYKSVLMLISVFWLLLRGFLYLKNRQLRILRELQLLLIYIALLVVVRFTFFPFSRINGQIQPLILDMARSFHFRINWIPFVSLMDYPEKKDALLNIIGNFSMFIPVGILWPIVFRELKTHGQALAAGVGFSLLIEIVQLPFYDRVTDIDDLILNSLGYAVGYGILLLVRLLRKRK